MAFNYNSAWRGLYEKIRITQHSKHLLPLHMPATLSFLYNFLMGLNIFNLRLFWMRNRVTLEFLGTWEQIYNPAFKVVEFDHFKSEAGLHTFVLSVYNFLMGLNIFQLRLFESNSYF